MRSLYFSCPDTARRLWLCQGTSSSATGAPGPLAGNQRDELARIVGYSRVTSGERLRIF